MSTEKPFTPLMDPMASTVGDLLKAHTAMNAGMTAMALSDVDDKTLAAFVLITGERAGLYFALVRAIADAPSEAIARATQDLKEAAIQADVREALLELVNVKSLKEAAGKTDEYEHRRVRAWNIARSALAAKVEAPKAPRRARAAKGG
jgi:hypothetical protein